MPIINRIADFQDEMTAWRRDLHAHPETAFEEHRTAESSRRSWPSSASRCIAASPAPASSARSRPGRGGRAIGLRADMDALHIQEKNGFDHASTECRQDACLRP